MQFNQLKRNIRNRKKITVGRGGKRGKTSGRGTKGQNARAGRKKRPEMRDIIKKLPKQRGYRFASFAKESVVVSLDMINKYFPTGGKITPNTLAGKGVINMEGKTYPRVKILGDGTIAAKFSVSQCEISRSAEEKIKKAGGDVKR